MPWQVLLFWIHENYLFLFFRACVEIKPTLYVPADDYNDNDDDGDVTREPEAGGSKPSSSKVPSEWSAQYSGLHDSCCLINTVAGKICSAVVSVTNDIASKICSSTAQLNPSKEHLKAIARFCAFQLAKTLTDNGFTWDDVTVNLWPGFPFRSRSRLLISITEFIYTCRC